MLSPLRSQGRGEGQGEVRVNVKAAFASPHHGKFPLDKKPARNRVMTVS